MLRRPLLFFCPLVGGRRGGWEREGWEVGETRRRLRIIWAYMQDSLADEVVPRSLAMARESLIRCRVSNEVKRLLHTIAAQRQITESALIRQLIEAMVQMVTRTEIADG